MSQEEFEKQTQDTIINQLKTSRINGFPFFPYTGIEITGRIKNGIVLKTPGNKNIKEIKIVYDRGYDSYVVEFDDGTFSEDVYFDQLADIIIEKMDIR